MDDEQDASLTDLEERLRGLEQRFEIQRRLTIFFIGLVAIYVALDLMARFA